MAVAFGSVTTNVQGNAGSGISVTTPSANVGDLLLIILSNDWYNMSELTVGVTPTVTVTEMTDFDVDGGANSPHIKAWWAPVPTAGAYTVTGDTNHFDEEKAIAVYIITGANTSAPIDNVAANSGLIGGIPIFAPSVSPNTSNALLICHAQTDGGSSGSSFSTPGGMSNGYNITDGSFMRAMGASQLLSSSGATGTRSFGGTLTSKDWVAASVAIKGPTGGGGSISAWLRA